ncbi:hypothetical protein [Haloarcula laminariae]|uniref:hypothetical protein n=1 Tax=Haloarcula laminariae TaxID=2961577 RepID=UPI0021C81F2C|nr:hypothetical protein [Halomicroarcula laminariae]
MNRRQFLSISALSLSLSGCMEVSFVDDNENNLPTPSLDSETESPTPSQTPEQPHDLYIVNYTTTKEIATVHILDENLNAVVEGQYELPSERGIEFKDIGAWETEYKVELSIDGTELTPLMWFTASCASVDEAPRGSRDGYVQLRRDGSDRLQATIAVNGCDAIIGPEYPTGPAQGFRVEE